jgi:hypothetical protein
VTTFSSEDYTTLAVDAAYGHALPEPLVAMQSGQIAVAAVGWLRDMAVVWLVHRDHDGYSNVDVELFRGAPLRPMLQPAGDGWGVGMVSKSRWEGRRLERGRPDPGAQGAAVIAGLHGWRQSSGWRSGAWAWLAGIAAADITVVEYGTNEGSRRSEVDTTSGAFLVVVDAPAKAGAPFIRAVRESGETVLVPGMASGRNSGTPASPPLT